MPSGCADLRCIDLKVYIALLRRADVAAKTNFPEWTSVSVAQRASFIEVQHSMNWRLFIVGAVVAW